MRNGHNDQCVCADCNTERQQAAIVPSGGPPEKLTVEVRDPGADPGVTVWLQAMESLNARIAGVHKFAMALSEQIAQLAARGPATVAVAPQQELSGLGIPPTMPSVVLPPVTAKRHMTMPQGLHSARVLGVVELQVEAVGAEIVALWLVDHDQRSWAIWFDRARREMSAAPLLA